MAFESLEQRLCLSGFYNFNMVFQTLPNGIIDIEPTASINDDGKVAFIASTNDGEAVWVGDGITSPHVVSFTTPTSNRTYGHELQINNSDQIAVVDRSKEYDYDIIAETGGTFSSLGRGPSINDSGFIAFVGESLNGNGDEADNIYAWNPVTRTRKQLMDPAFMYPNLGAGSLTPGTQAIFGEVQINNNNDVLARRRLNAEILQIFGLLTAPLRYLETWNAVTSTGLPNHQPAMAYPDGISLLSAFTNPPTAGNLPSPLDPNSPYEALFPSATINNLGQVNLSAIARGAGISRVSTNVNAARQGFGGIGNRVIQPMLADNGYYVMTSDLGEVFVERWDLGAPFQVLASGGSGFTSVSEAGISDDGSVITFTGVNTTTGDGLYVSLFDAGSGTYTAPVKILGISGDGVLDPGETHNDANGDGVVDPGEDVGGMVSFDLSSRTAVNRTTEPVNSKYTVAFLANDDPSNALALFTARVDIADRSAIRVDDLLTAAMVGENLPGLSGNVAGISLHDSVNNNGHLTFWVSTSSGTQAVVGAQAPVVETARVWDANNPGVPVTIGFGVSPQTTPPSDFLNSFDSVLSSTSIDNAGNVAFAGLETANDGLPYEITAPNFVKTPAPESPLDNDWEIHVTDRFQCSLSPCVDASDGRNAAPERTTLDPAKSFGFQVADGSLLLGSRESTGDTEVTLIDSARTSTQVATTVDGTWNDLGIRPGISDDEGIVAFFGSLSSQGADAATLANGPSCSAPVVTPCATSVVPVPVNAGDGIFLSVPVGGERHIVEVAGELDSDHIDPGERLQVGTNVQLGPDFDFNGTADWGFDAISSKSSVSISALKPFADPSKGQYATVLFMANDVVNGVPSAEGAIYASRVNFFLDASENIQSVGVEAPVQVVRLGETEAGFGPIDGLSIHDSVNAVGVIAFHAESGGRDAVITAHVNNVDQVRGNPRFDPDSPLVEYVVRADAPTFRTATRGPADVHQVIMHATVGKERGDIRTLGGQNTPGCQNRNECVSIHYLVSREGRVTQIVEERDVAFHAPPSNNSSIGIELEDGGPTNNHRTNVGWLQTIQQKKTALLVRDIALRNNITASVSGIDVIPHPSPTNNLLYPPSNPTSIVSAGLRPMTQTTFPPANLPTPGPFEIAGNYQAGVRRGSFFYDGFDGSQVGILDHGQVLNRTQGKDDPRNFPWAQFINQVNLGIAATLNSPADIFITDPLGRRLGVDPITGQLVNEIPGAQHSGASSHPQSVAIPMAMDGVYDFQVVGTGTGSYSLNLFASGVDGGSFSTQVSDTIVSGTVIGYQLAYQSTSAEETTVTGNENLPPHTNDDYSMTTQNRSVVIVVLNNDSDPDGALDHATVTITALPDNGTVAVDAVTGVVVYTPDPGWSGEDTFQYTVNDDAGLPSNVSSVSVFVARTLSPGDANGDGRVDAADLNIVGINWRGTNKTWSQGDFTGDGLVDAADLNLLALNWRSGVEAAAAAANDADRTGEGFGVERLPRAPLPVADRSLTRSARLITFVDVPPNADVRSTSLVPKRTKLDGNAVKVLAQDEYSFAHSNQVLLFSERNLRSNVNHSAIDRFDALFERIGESDWESLDWERLFG